MDVFIRVSAGVLITLILCIVLSKQGKDFSFLLTVCVCCIVAVAALDFISPVIDFFHKLQSIGNLDSQMISIIFRAVGISLLSEITCLICVDAGNAALGKTLQVLATSVVLWMSVPLFTSLIELVEDILNLT